MLEQRANSKAWQFGWRVEYTPWGPRQQSHMSEPGFAMVGKKDRFFAMIGKKVDKAVEDEHNQMLQINIKQALTKK